MSTPSEALQRLKEGNQRFVSGDRNALQKSDAKRLAEVATGQQPYAAILSCADSRVPPELIFDEGLGDLFVVRVAGNVVKNTQVGSLEFAVGQLGARLIVVLGHSRCGAVNAALAGAVNLSPALSKVVAPIAKVVSRLRENQPELSLDEAIQANVRQSVAELKKRSLALSAELEEGSIAIIGAVYDLETGQVEFLENEC